jgi:hypothetical protein
MVHTIPLLRQAESVGDPKRREDLERSDAELTAFSEEQLLQADLDYLAGQKRRDQQRITLLHEIELNELRCRGGL